MDSLVRFMFVWLSKWPLPLLHALGWLIGAVVFVASGRYRRRLLTHVRQAGFGASVAWAAVGEEGKMVAELPRLWLGPPVPVCWDGAEHVDAAIARGLGVVYLTPHLGGFELTARAVAERFGQRMPLTVLYRPARQSWLGHVMTESRTRTGLHTAPTSLAGVRQLVRALRAGQAVGLLPDQVPPAGQGVWAPFFGRDAYTMTLWARLVQSCAAQPLVVWGQRLSWGRGFVVHIRPLEGLGGQAVPAEGPQAAVHINRVMQGLVRQCPAQYLWSYARYKNPRAKPLVHGTPD